MLPPSLVFLDTETTGLSVRKDRIIEIGLVRVENEKVVAQYQTLLNPGSYLSPFITNITGITSDELVNAPFFEDIQRQLSELLDGTVMVAHNARFDYGFLKNEFLRCEKRFSLKHFCTAKLSRMLFPQFPHHNLDSIIQRYNITVAKRHRAFDDAYVLWEFYQKLQKSFPHEVLENAITQQFYHPSLPTLLPKEQLDALPHTPGVYIFYGEGGMPLYVGKSVNLKDRVRSHFSSDHTSSKEMKLSQQIRSLESIQTAGELGALLKEAQMIKNLQPLYNRKLRFSRRLILAKSIIDKSGYMKVVLEDATSIHPDEIETVLGTFRSKKQAKEYLQNLAKEHHLCEKLLGIENTSTGCFSYRLGQCYGACVGKENPLSYNPRCIIAFSKNKIKPWPFRGPIVITEKSEETQLQESFLVDKWCLLGKHTAEDTTKQHFEEKDYRFDLDTYKILLSFLEKNSSSAHISPLKMYLQSKQDQSTIEYV